MSAIQEISSANNLVEKNCVKKKNGCEYIEEYGGKQCYLTQNNERCEICLEAKLNEIQDDKFTNVEDRKKNCFSTILLNITFIQRKYLIYLQFEKILNVQSLIKFLARLCQVNITRLSN